MTLRFLGKTLGVVLVAWLAIANAAQAQDKNDQALLEKTKTIAGTAEFLRAVPKHFARLVAVDPAKRQVTLLVEGERLAKVWTVVPDAELKVSGWWGRLEQFTPGDRVWAWFKMNRASQPLAISMLADELSEQDIHGAGVTLKRVDGGKISLQGVKGDVRELDASRAEVHLGDAPGRIADLPAGTTLYVQSAGGDARLVLDAAAFEKHRREQRESLDARWITEGLPGTVAFLHIFSGEMDLMLDHEAMRWGRWLKPGDEVTLEAEPPIKAVVKSATPWRERTQLRLVVNGLDQADLAPGQRLSLHVPTPPVEVNRSSLPADLDRPRSKDERIEWFLATIYCSCTIGGDICTGHFYTLASCNPNGCGMPNHMRQILAQQIDKGLTDRQILEELSKERGSDLLRPHLAP
ncbi:MAG: hypothetical protein WD063_06785 [Pirellulales bacterium]